MGLIRAIARPMLAAPFIAGGISQLQNADKLANVAGPFIHKIAEPAGLPDDPELLVKANGALMITAGAGLATGIMRKPSAALLGAALVPTTLAAHSFWEYEDPGQRAIHKTGFFNNVGLLGGLVLALVDTEGKPGLLYRARSARRTVSRSADVTRRDLKRTAKFAKREAKHAAKAARREAKIATLEIHDALD
ncbi:DoxX family protein [Cumulibacter soli]|uniref:DoxX family protein n=1 Tax=Cumulibacter soli TaxID=2546344 RepID=UPI001067FD00|nr:DoxX family protein [Cumulibacter soli]